MMFLSLELILSHGHNLSIKERYATHLEENNKPVSYALMILLESARREEKKRQALLNTNQDTASVPGSRKTKVISAHPSYCCLTFILRYSCK